MRKQLTAFSSSSYSFPLDLARALAIIGVVAIHVFLPIYTRPDFLGGISWWFAYGINAMSRIAVPLFIMISGCLLLQKKPRHQITDSLSRAFFRIGIPLVTWSYVYFWWELFRYGRRTSLAGALDTFFSGDVFHLYFLVILFGLYILLPLFRVFVQKASQAIQLYMIVLLLVIGFAIYCFQFFIFETKTGLNFFTWWVPYAGYFLAGHYLSKRSFPLRSLRIFAAVFVLLWLVTVVLGYKNLELLSSGDLTFWGIGGTEYVTHFLTPNIILMSLLGFVMITQSQLSAQLAGSQLSSIIKSIARSAFGIYLIHLLIIGYLDLYGGFAIHQVSGQLWLYGLIKMAIVFIASWLLTVLAVNIPIIKYFFGAQK